MNATTKTRKTHFYDIESLDNVFSLCNYKPEENHIDIYYLCDDSHITAVPINITNVLPDYTLKDTNECPTLHDVLLDRIYKKNHNFRGTIQLYDLRYEEANRHLAKTFGLSDAYMINDPKSNSSYPDEFRLVCDSDPEYDETIHPYLMGYNSDNYDTTMLALYFFEAFPLKAPDLHMEFYSTSAKVMRIYNDELFSPRFKDSMPTRLTQIYDEVNKRWSETNYSNPKWRIRKNMKLSGRHIDVAKLNEKAQKVGLKRIIGMLGGQILESDKLRQGASHIETLDQFLDLIAYNVSDVVNLKLVVFDHKFYQGQFALKQGLLQSYPELKYEKLPNEYKPDIRPEKVRRDRLTIDSSSAQLATKALCPYGHLTDIPAVSFMYPSEEKAKELGIPRLNILDESRKFFYQNFPQPELRAKFDAIYYYYKSIEGKNFNESENYKNDYMGKPEYRPPSKISSIPKTDNCLFYYNKDGSPSSCFVTFSIGGIHGAEYNKVLFEHDTAEFEEELNRLKYVQSIYPDPIELKKAKKITIDNKEYAATKFLKSGSTLQASFYKDLESKRPVLFKREDDGSLKLNTKYVFTSADATNHEDFCSYYPNLLIMLLAFLNEGLGYDRYAEIFDDKQKYGKLMKDKSLSDSEREHYSILREGTKLILNSASGAADANFESNIRMNNMIISMRIIGQLFSWRIGQAQTIHGAKITSTNTDGLYSVLPPEINNPILAKESADINIEIEPEPTYLISKDTNNRIEMNPDTGEVESASGGTLACRKGPNPTKALAHPAIIDWALTEYLIMVSLNHKNLSLSTPFDDELGRKILISAKDKFEPSEFLRMFQNILASSIGSINYIFATTNDNPSRPIIMQHYNRVFILKDGTENTVHLYAANARQITPAQKKKRENKKERLQQHNDIATQVLNANGVDINALPKDKEAIVKKVTNIEDTWYMFIQNKDLNDLTNDELSFIINNLDYEKYLQLLKDCFEKNWRNKMPANYTETTQANESDMNQTVTTNEPQSEPITEQVTLDPQKDQTNDQFDAHDTSMDNIGTQNDHKTTVPVANGSGDLMSSLQERLINDLKICLDTTRIMDESIDRTDFPIDYTDNIRKSIQTVIDNV